MHTLYACLGSGNCYKPWLAMTQLGCPFDIRLVNVLTGEHKSKEYLAVNPLGVVPFLKTSCGRAIGESNAMLWYLAEGTHLMPDASIDRAEALQWMFFEQTKLEPFISPARFFTTILPDQREARADDIAAWQEQAVSGLTRLDEHLATRHFILESGYSVADISDYGYVHVFEEAGLDPKNWPAIMRWVDRVSATPGYAPLSELGRSQLAAE